ncbi:sugar ABC transporter substrate-binding protein [Bifidobacterium amazonense]|uniref:Sugar ABC transporter substrate-binding protein n=1 Tax=Bifidobacterium amazonense TaxID=2809027 RepID=A0ABS9VX37_9BIFI|nr:sugar ABC transporter substrate-binding protein [Bifidobacterium amazonense]MCH9276380.1 sugar ABC transporter substrate-binding protein [Bifidobacterium amazonense]
MTTGRVIRRIAAAMTVLAACVPLAACEPAGRAVGDTQDTMPAVAHNEEPRVDVLVGVIGSAHADTASSSDAADTRVIDALDRAGVKAVYVSVADAQRPVGAARQGISDMIDRRAYVIVVAGVDAGGTDADDWSAALGLARGAGIPIALLDPIAAPDDDTLFAASLHVDDDAANAVSLAKTLADIVNDRPHGRDIVVTTASGQYR